MVSNDKSKEKKKKEKKASKEIVIKNHHLVHDDIGSLLRSLNLFNVSLNGVDGDLVGGVDIVPNAEIGAVLRHDHIAVRNPLHVRAEVQQLRSGLIFQVVDMKEAPFVSKQEEVGSSVKLQPIDL